MLTGLQVVRPFVRTVGDEVQGLLDHELSVVTATMMFMRSSAWHVGIGVGPVEQPVPEDVRAARGPAFLAARSAVTRAKTSPLHLAVEATDRRAELDAHDAEAVLHLLAVLWNRRTTEGWEAIDLASQARTQAEVAERLGVTRQAVNQRLAAAHWGVERAAVPVVARALARAEAHSTSHWDSG